MQKTADELNRSLGFISQAILVSSWLKTHETQLRKQSCRSHALDFIRMKKRERELAELD